MQPVNGNYNQVGKRVGDYMFTKMLGKGAYAEVFQAKNSKTDKVVAIKCVRKVKQAEHNGLVGRMLQTEITVLQQLKNPNVVRLEDSFESTNQTYLVLEYCNEGDFESYWRKQQQRRFPEEQAIHFLKQILNGMKGLHEMKVIHRDLKLANLLMHDKSIKIADLGFAHQLNYDGQLLNLALGSLGTMAPEVLENKHYGLLADMFSIGSIYYQLLFGEFPFPVKSNDAFLNAARAGKIDFNYNGIKISPQSQDVLRKMLAYEPLYRIKWTDLYRHQIFQMQGPAQALSFEQLAANRVDVNGNQKVYAQIENNFQPQPKLGFQGNGQKLRQVNEVQESRYGSNDQEERQILEAIQRSIKDQQEKEEEKRVILERYFQIRNKPLFLIKLYEILRSQSQGNPSNDIMLICFFLVKKALQQSRQLSQRILSQENLFNYSRLSELQETSEFNQFFDIVLSDDQLQETQLDYLISELAQNKEFFQKNAHILTKEIQPDFDQMYQESLFDFSLNQASFNKSELNLAISVMLCRLYGPGLDKFEAQNGPAEKFLEGVGLKSKDQQHQIFNQLMDL